MKISDIINGRYYLKSFVGVGVFGEVWNAHDNVLNMDVAIKFYASSDVSSISKLQQEYRKAFELSHANILSPKHFDVADGCPFMIYNLCGAGSVRKLIGYVDERAVWRVILDVSQGLQALHEHSIVHKNLKPENILIKDDHSFAIMDIALGKSTRATMSKESVNRYTGSIAYKAPESITGKTASPKSDIWSLGAIAFELIMGDLPKESDLSKTSILLSTKKISQQLCETISSCLSKEASNRPSACKLRNIAQKVLDGEQTEVNSHNEEKCNSFSNVYGTQREGAPSNGSVRQLASRNWFVTFYEWGLVLLSLFAIVACCGLGFENASRRDNGFEIPDYDVSSLYVDEWFVIALLFSVKLLGEIMLLAKIKVGYIVSSSALFCATYATCKIGENFEPYILMAAFAITAFYMLVLWLVLLIRKNGYNQWKNMSRNINLSEQKWIVGCLVAFIVLFLICELLTR